MSVSGLLSVVFLSGLVAGVLAGHLLVIFFNPDRAHVGDFFPDLAF